MLLLLKIKNIKVLNFKYLLSCSADVIELMTNIIVNIIVNFIIAKLYGKRSHKNKVKNI